MNNNWSGRRTLAVVTICTALGLAIGLLMILSIWSVLHAGGATSSYWAMIEALATAVTAATVIGAGFLAYRELDEASNSRHLAVADRLFEELNAPENVAARRWIFQHLSPNPATAQAELTDQDRDTVKRVLNSLDRVAFLTQGGWIPEDMVMPWMSPMILKAWIKLKPWVDYEVDRRHEPDYYRQVRALAERCLSWREAHGMSIEVVWVENAL
jgi:heme/copper-type cytochrome/quinol oxidase subunit 2